MYLSLHQDSEIQNLIKSSDNETYISHHDCKFICYRNNCHNTIRSGLEHIVICGTQIMTTVIVTPLGVFAIAANSFAITAESLCICPVWDCRCCTTLVGQSIGADRRKLVRSFARITIIYMVWPLWGYRCTHVSVRPPNYRLDAPVGEIRELGIMALRIEAFAEPMFAASIITYGVFVGAADTLVPCLMNFFNIRAVRLSLAALLAPSLGLKSVWVAMCIKLCFRGLIFLVRLKRERWMRHM